MVKNDFEKLQKMESIYPDLSHEHGEIIGICIEDEHKICLKCILEHNHHIDNVKTKTDLYIYISKELHNLEQNINYEDWCEQEEEILAQQPDINELHEMLILIHKKEKSNNSEDIITELCKTVSELKRQLKKLTISWEFFDKIELDELGNNAKNFRLREKIIQDQILVILLMGDKLRDSDRSVICGAIVGIKIIYDLANKQLLQKYILRDTCEAGNFTIGKDDCLSDPQIICDELIIKNGKVEPKDSNTVITNKCIENNGKCICRDKYPRTENGITFIAPNLAEIGNEFIEMNEKRKQYKCVVVNDEKEILILSNE